MSNKIEYCDGCDFLCFGYDSYSVFDDLKIAQCRLSHNLYPVIAQELRSEQLTGIRRPNFCPLCNN